jgi:hypothetical protein
MGEYTRSGKGFTNGLYWAVEEVFTISNFIISVVLAIIGHLFFEYLRKRL